MGLQPIPPPAPPPFFTRLDALKRDYVIGSIDLDDFERQVGELLAGGTADEYVRLVPNPGKDSSR